jgi:hypothetical protein
MCRKESKFCSMLEFGDNSVYLRGLSGFLEEKDVLHSIESECTHNDGGDYKQIFIYVVHEEAREAKEIDPATGIKKTKEKGHEGWTLQKFCLLEIAEKAGLRVAHVVVLRLYTGSLYKPWNAALRALLGVDKNPDAKKLLLQWGTCIAVLYDAIILLSTQTPPTTVMRGLPADLKLPAEFTDPTAKACAGYAGGVEMGFMSTTADERTAIQFSGGPDNPGVILKMTFTGASRGADVQAFSMWPEEQEFIFPPFTFLTFRKKEQRGLKLHITVDATVRQGPDFTRKMDLGSCGAVPPWALVDQDGYYLLVAAQPPPVAAGNVAHTQQSMRSLAEFADALGGVRL